MLSKLFGDYLDPVTLIPRSVTSSHQTKEIYIPSNEEVYSTDRTHAKEIHTRR